MACPQQQNLETKRTEKLTKYRQLAFEMRERRTGYEIKILPAIMGALGGGVKKVLSDLSNLVKKRELVIRTAAEMQKTILLDSEAIIRKVLLGLTQSDLENN